MKHYYKMEMSAEENVCGDYPQCYKFVKGFPEEKEDVFDHLHREHNKIEEPLPSSEIQRLDGYMLAGRAKLTDCLSHVKSFVPLVNEKALKVFTQFNLGEHRIIPGWVEKRRKPIEYYFIYLSSRLNDKIVWNKCVFDVSWRGILIGAKHYSESGYNSMDDYNAGRTMHYNEGHGFHNPEKIVFDNTFPLDLDMFRLPILDTDTFVSGELKEALINENITGLHFSDIPEIIIEE